MTTPFDAPDWRGLSREDLDRGLNNGAAVAGSTGIVAGWERRSRSSPHGVIVIACHRCQFRWGDPCGRPFASSRDQNLSWQGGHKGRRYAERPYHDHRDGMPPLLIS